MLYDAAMNRSPGSPTLALAALALAILSLVGPEARADIPPSCGAQDSLITCAATDVGKPCQGGGQCFEIACSNGASSGKVYKCDACPTIIEASTPACSIPTLEMACTGADGGTGTCAPISAHCATGAGKFVCQTPAAARPTGPPGGGTGDGGTDATVKADSGCDVAPKPGKPTMIGVGLVAAGIAFFLIDRARRRSR